MINILTVLAALPGLIQSGGSIAQLLEEIVDSFSGQPETQDSLREAIQDLREGNDEGHARYQAKLAAAAAQE